MSEENKVMEYDEDDSLEFIKEHLPEDLKEGLSDDDIDYVVDLIYEYYDEKGFLDDDDDSDIEIDEDELYEYVLKVVREDESTTLTDDQVEAIITGELDYCDSINFFDED